MFKLFQKKQKTVGAGTARRIEREAAERKHQDERLANAHLGSEMTRQIYRAAMRQEAKKNTLSPSKVAFMMMTKRTPKYPRTTFAY